MTRWRKFRTWPGGNDCLGGKHGRHVPGGKCLSKGSRSSTGKDRVVMPLRTDQRVLYIEVEWKKGDVLTLLFFKDSKSGNRRPIIIE